MQNYENEKKNCGGKCPNIVLKGLKGERVCAYCEVARVIDWHWHLNVSHVSTALHIALATSLAVDVQLQRPQTSVVETCKAN